MSDQKIETIRRTADDYKRLPNTNQMFVLGYMQGVLSVLHGEHGSAAKQREGKEGGEKVG